jgi:hypothetical protein
VFESELEAELDVYKEQKTSNTTYCCNVDASCEVWVALYLSPVDAVKNLAHIRRQGRQDFRP